MRIGGRGLWRGAPHRGATMPRGGSGQARSATQILLLRSRYFAKVARLPPGSAPRDARRSRGEVSLMKTVVALRVNRSGKAIAASEGGREWIARAGTSLCHRVIDARTLEGKPVCSATCAGALAAGHGRGHCGAQVVVRGEVVRLDCHSIFGTAVVLVEGTGRAAPETDESDR